MGSVKIIRFKGKKLKDGSYPILIQIIHERGTKRISLGCSATDEQWNEELKEFSRKKPNQKWLNNKIHAERNRIEAAILKLEQEKEGLSLHEIRSEIQVDRAKSSFYQYTEQIIQDLIKAKKIGNADVYRTTLGVIKAFTEGNDFSFREMDFKWLKQFEVYHLSKGNTLNGLNVYMRTLRAIYNKAMKEGIIRKELYPFRFYKLKYEKPRKRAIRKSDIDKIRDLELPEGGEIWNARNYFMFSFYARGMNWIDMANLKVTDISDGCLYYKRSKTGKEYRIKITGKMKEILDHYTAGKRPKAFIFPIIQRPDDPILVKKDINNGLKNFNKYLKQIADLCGIETKLTSYVSRHSWGTIGYKELGLPVGIISQGYGHGDIKTTQVYLEEFDDEALNKANELITG